MSVVGRLDIDLLTAFVAVVDAGGFTRAAERLNRTQSGVSMQVKRLEERAGRQLLARGGRTPVLTAAGRDLYGYASRVVALTEEARSRLAAPDLVGRVRVGLPEWFAGSHLQGVLAGFARAHPGVRVSVRVGDSATLRAAVADGEQELALAMPAETGDAAGEATVVHSEPMQWVAAADAPGPPPTPAPLALFEAPCPYRAWTTAALEARGWTWRESFTGASVASVRAAIGAGLAIGLLPACARTPAVEPVTGLPEPPPMRLTVHTSGQPDAAVAEIHGHLTRALAGAAAPDAVVSA